MLGRRQTIFEHVHQVGPVRQPGQLVVAGRVPQLLGRPALLGDVLDVGDRQHHPVVLGGRHPGAGPDELAVAAAVALVDPERVDDAELEPGPMWLGRADVVGMGELAQRASDQLVDVAPQHLGQRLVGVDDAAVVEPHERHPGRRRLERLLEATPCLIERPALLLSLGNVPQPHDQTPFAGRTPGVAREMERRLDHHPSGRPTEHLDLDRLDLIALEGALDGSPELHLLVAVGVLEQVALDQLATRQIEQREGGGVGAVHDVVGVDQQHRLGQFVEQATDLALGGLDRLELAAHLFRLPAAVPDAGDEHDDRDGAEADHQQVLGTTHATRLDPHRP